MSLASLIDQLRQAEPSIKLSSNGLQATQLICSYTVINMSTIYEGEFFNPSHYQFILKISI